MQCALPVLVGGKMINDLIMGLVNGQCKTEGLLVCINHMVKRIVIIIIV